MPSLRPVYAKKITSIAFGVVSGQVKFIVIQVKIKTEQEEYENIKNALKEPTS